MVHKRLCERFDAVLLDFHDTLVTTRKQHYVYSDFADLELLRALARQAVHRKKLLALVSFGTLSELGGAMAVALGQNQTVFTTDTIVAADHAAPKVGAAMARCTLAQQAAHGGGKDAMLLGLCEAYGIDPARALYIDDSAGLVARARLLGFEHAYACPRVGLTRSWLEELEVRIRAHSRSYFVA